VTSRLVRESHWDGEGRGVSEYLKQRGKNLCSVMLRQDVFIAMMQDECNAVMLDWDAEVRSDSKAN